MTGNLDEEDGDGSVDVSYLEGRRLDCSRGVKSMWITQSEDLRFQSGEEDEVHQHTPQRDLTYEPRGRESIREGGLSSLSMVKMVERESITTGVLWGVVVGRWGMKREEGKKVESG